MVEGAEVVHVEPQVFDVLCNGGVDDRAGGVRHATNQSPDGPPSLEIRWRDPEDGGSVRRERHRETSRTEDCGRRRLPRHFAVDLEVRHAPREERQRFLQLRPRQ